MGRLTGPPRPPSPTGLPSRVDSQLGSLPQGQPVCDHLDPSSIEAIASSHVEVAHQGVWGHPSPSLAAHLGCSTLKRKPPLSQNPNLGARCSMMANWSSWRPHRHVREDKSKGKRRVCTAGPGKVWPQFWSSCWWASHPMLFFHDLPVKALGGFLLPTHLGFVGLWVFCKNDLLAVREFCPTTSPKTVVSATAGCLWRTIFRESAQLTQWAPSLILVALVSPKPLGRTATKQ